MSYIKRPPITNNDDDDSDADVSDYAKSIRLKSKEGAEIHYNCQDITTLYSFLLTMKMYTDSQSFLT